MVVAKLDRLGRSAVDLHAIAAEHEEHRKAIDDSRGLRVVSRRRLRNESRKRLLRLVPGTCDSLSACLQGQRDGVLVVSAAIPASAVLVPNDSTVAALLGAVVVILAGLRAVFHWQDNYLRFSGAREAVEAERRLYHTSAVPYEDAATRDQILAAAVSKIEQEEMAGWVKRSPRSGPSPDLRDVTAVLASSPVSPLCRCGRTIRDLARATPHDMADRVTGVRSIRAVLGRMRLAGRVGGWRRGRPRAACRAPASCAAGLGRR